MTTVANKRIRVLVVDDSAFMRRVLHGIITADAGMEVVGQASDGREAVAMAEALKPDVITMDINMPHMDGLQATEHIMSLNPRPIVVVSSESRQGADSTLRALELGAIEFVAKPSGAVDLDMNSVRDGLLHKLRMASKVRVVRTATRSDMPGESPTSKTSTGLKIADLKIPPRNGGSAPLSAPVPAPEGKANGRFPIVVIAASTGGPVTLMRFLPRFPKDFAAAVILVQHMPATFTAQFSQQLAENTKLRVKEAESGELLQPGTIYVCPGSHHLRVVSGGRIALDPGPRISGYLPCADVTLESAANYARGMTIGVVLTGMGNDASLGIRAVKSAGGLVLAQDESTSVIFGMPGEAIKTGAVDLVLPLDDIFPALEKCVRKLCAAVRVGAR